MFIKSYKINTKVCDNLIKCFYENKNFHTEGTIGLNAVDKKIKDSTDLNVFNLNSNTDTINYYMALDKCINKYKKEFKFCDKDQKPWSVIQSPVIQKYKPNGGFKKWHYENNGDCNDGPLSSIKRHLVFMTYLNDVEKGGETEFFYQKKKYKPKKGLTLIWPAIWTHTHKGVVSKKHTKYIITGWINYN